MLSRYQAISKSVKNGHGRHAPSRGTELVNLMEIPNERQDHSFVQKLD